MGKIFNHLKWSDFSSLKMESYSLSSNSAAHVYLSTLAAGGSEAEASMAHVGTVYSEHLSGQQP